MLFLPEKRKTVKSSSGGRARHRNRSGVVELVGREPLIIARVENGVTKFSPKKRKPGKIFTLCFGPRSQSIGRGRISREGALDHRESRERRDKIFAAKTENAKIFKIDFGSGISFQWGIFIFLAAGKLTFWGGVITSKLASQ